MNSKKDVRQGASPVHASAFWNSFFSVLGSAKCKLSQFWHSLRCLPCTSQGPSKSTWPMAIPFPDLHRLGSKAPRQGARCARKLALNATVLVLSWLYLGQPSLARPGLGLELGAPLSDVQRSTLERLAIGIDSWNAEPRLGPEEMGRGASKVEALERMLDALQRQFSSSLPTKHLEAAGNSDPCFPRLLLPPPSLGDIVYGLGPDPLGFLAHASEVLAKSVEPARLTFVDKPTFDPCPFLDNETRQIYRDPLRLARSLEEGEPVPHVSVRCSRLQALELLEALDRTGRLAFVDSASVRPRLRNGIFAIPKDLHRDRMVLDARPPNQVEPPARRWLASLGNLCQLQHLHLCPDDRLELHVEDLREFYHAFVIGGSRLKRNALALEFAPAEVGHMESFPSSLRSVGKVTPVLRTLAMGDSSAVAIAQTAHLSVLLRFSSLTLSHFVTLSGLPPRDGLSAGLLIDDFAVFDRVPRCLPQAGDTSAPALAEEEAPTPGTRVAEAVRAAYAQTGLPRHAKKSVSRSVRCDLWGGTVDGIEGRIWPALRRTVPWPFFSCAQWLLGLQLRSCSRP